MASTMRNRPGRDANRHSRLDVATSLRQLALMGRDVWDVQRDGTNSAKPIAPESACNPARPSHRDDLGPGVERPAALSGLVPNEELFDPWDVMWESADDGLERPEVDSTTPMERVEHLAVPRMTFTMNGVASGTQEIPLIRCFEVAADESVTLVVRVHRATLAGSQRFLVSLRNVAQSEEEMGTLFVDATDAAVVNVNTSVTPPIVLYADASPVGTSFTLLLSALQSAGGGSMSLTFEASVLRRARGRSPMPPFELVSPAGADLRAAEPVPMVPVPLERTPRLMERANAAPMASVAPTPFSALAAQIDYRTNAEFMERSRVLGSLGPRGPAATDTELSVAPETLVSSNSSSEELIIPKTTFTLQPASGVTQEVPLAKSIRVAPDEDAVVVVRLHSASFVDPQTFTVALQAASTDVQDVDDSGNLFSTGVDIASSTMRDTDTPPKAFYLDAPAPPPEMALFLRARQAIGASPSTQVVTLSVSVVRKARGEWPLESSTPEPVDATCWPKSTL